MDLPSEQRTLLLDVVRGVIRDALTGMALRPLDFPDPLLHQPAGCFVSLHNHRGALRGCVGKLDAEQPLLAAARSAALSVLRDPRFEDRPVTRDELADLMIELSILSPMRRLETALAFEPLEHGVVLTIGDRSGCFLPQVARETGWSREQLLARLCSEKLGLPPDAWRSSAAVLSIFSALICGPEPFECSTVSNAT